MGIVVYSLLWVMQDFLSSTVACYFPRTFFQVVGSLRVRFESYAQSLRRLEHIMIFLPPCLGFTFQGLGFGVQNVGNPITSLPALWRSRSSSTLNLKP